MAYWREQSNNDNHRVMRASMCSAELLCNRVRVCWLLAAMSRLRLWLELEQVLLVGLACIVYSPSHSTKSLLLSIPRAVSADCCNSCDSKVFNTAR